MRLIDRLILGRLAGIYGSVIAVTVAVMLLENTSRVLARIADTRSPLPLLANILAMLIPEYVSIAIPIAVFLSTAMVMRRLALQNELPVLAAAGVSLRRLMLVPALIGALSAIAQAGFRFELQPAGEQALDRLMHKADEGQYGVALRSGTFFQPAPGIVLTTGTIEGLDGHIKSVILKTPHEAINAAQATIYLDGAGGLLLDLKGGVIIENLRSQPRSMLFDTMRIQVPGTPRSIPKSPAAERLDRLDFHALVNRIQQERSGRTHTALAALTTRCAVALICLILPWLAAPLAIPPPRGNHSFGILLGVAAIAAFLRIQGFVELHASSQPVAATVAHLSVWGAAGMAMFGLAARSSQGTVLELLSATFNRVKAFYFKNLTM